MLKKVFVLGVVCALSLAYAKDKSRALDYAQKSMKDFGSDVHYTCYGNDTEARCSARNITDFPFSINNFVLDVNLSDYEYKRKVSFDLETSYFREYEKFVPNNLTCEGVYNLKDLDVSGSEHCVLSADVATMEFDIDSSITSKNFNYKDMFKVVQDSFDKPRDLLDRLSNVTQQNSQAALDDYFKGEDELDNLYAERESLIESHKHSVTNNKKSSCGCGHHKGDSKPAGIKDLLNDRKYIEDKLAQNSSEIAKVTQENKQKKDEREAEYQEEKRDIEKSIVKYLSNYNLKIKEIRIYIKGNKLADTTFATYAQDFFNFNENTKLNKKEKKAREEEKKRVTAGYYSSIEAMRAASITFISQSQYLNDNHKKNFIKILDLHAKLFEPHAHKNSIRILITPLSDKSINLGKEAKKIIKFANDEISSEEFVKTLFDTINQYDIRAVRFFPQ